MPAELESESNLVGIGVEQEAIDFDSAIISYEDLKKSIDGEF